MPKKKAPAKTAAPKPLTPWQRWSADPEQAIESLCAHVSAGGHMAGLCQAHGINYTTMMQWVAADPKRAAMYARAREERADVLADEICAIADEVKVEEVTDSEGNVVDVRLDATAIARNRLRVDARKWVAAKLKPRTYGDKLDVTAEVGIKSLPDEQLMAEAARLAAKLGLSVSSGDTKSQESRVGTDRRD